MMRFGKNAAYCIYSLRQVCIHVFSTHSFLCKHIADPTTDQRMAHFSLVPPSKVLTFMVHGCGRLPLIWLFHGSPYVSKQNLNRLNFPSVNQRRASKANNKAVLNWFDTDILNRPRETSSRNSEHNILLYLADMIKSTQWLSVWRPEVHLQEGSHSHLSFQRLMQPIAPFELQRR